MDIITVAPTASGAPILPFVWMGVAVLCALATLGLSFLNLQSFRVEYAVYISGVITVCGAIYVAFNTFGSWSDKLDKNHEREDAEWIEQIDETYGIEVSRGQLSDLDIPTEEPPQPAEYGSTDVWFDDQLTAVTLTWTGNEFVLVDGSDDLVPELP